MTQRDPRLVLQTSPFLQTGVTTPRIMRDVILAALPTLAAATWNFGVVALLVVGSATAGAVGMEWLTTRKRPDNPLLDGSALLTGLLLGLTLPPGIPLWMAFLGGVVGIGLGKAIWGGLGQNLFNPALIGRAFLQAAFPITLTSWMPNRFHGEQVAGFWRLGEQTLAAPLMRRDVEVVTAATPLGLQKFEGTLTDLGHTVIGTTGGSLGETSAILIVLGGLYLLWRRAFDWRIPAAILGTVVVFVAVLHYGFDASRFPTPWFSLTTGGLLFGTVFMATDPVTSPTSPKGAVIFGVGVGVLVVLIRHFGGLPEGVMYAILLMNTASPLIDRTVQSRVFGRGRKAAS